MVQPVLTSWRNRSVMYNFLKVPQIATIAAAGLMLALTAAGQQASPPAKPPAAKPAATRSANVPHLPDGHPNMNGIWQTMNTANWDLLPHSAEQGLVLQAGAQL